MVMLVNMLFLCLVTCGGGDIYRHDGSHAISKSNHKAYGHDNNGILQGLKNKSIVCGLLWKKCNHCMFYKASRTLHSCLPFM